MFFIFTITQRVSSNIMEPDDCNDGTQFNDDVSILCVEPIVVVDKGSNLFNGTVSAIALLCRKRSNLIPLYTWHDEDKTNSAIILLRNRPIEIKGIFRCRSFPVPVTDQGIIDLFEYERNCRLYPYVPFIRNIKGSLISSFHIFDTSNIL